MCSPILNLPSYKEPPEFIPCVPVQGLKCLPCGIDPVTLRRPLIVGDSTFDYRPTSWPGMIVNNQDKKVRYQLINYERPVQPNKTARRIMSVLPRGFEGPQPSPRFGCVRGEYSIYYKRPCYGQPRPQPFQREVTQYCGGPSNAPCERPCCYDFPCKAHCFNHGAVTRPSGRYARTVWYPGECCPVVPPCQAFTCPNPPYHPCCVATVNKNV